MVLSEVKMGWRHKVFPGKDFDPDPSTFPYPLLAKKDELNIVCETALLVAAPPGPSMPPFWPLALDTLFPAICPGPAPCFPLITTWLTRSRSFAIQFAFSQEITDEAKE